MTKSSLDLYNHCSVWVGHVGIDKYYSYLPIVSIPTALVYDWKNETVVSFQANTNVRIRESFVLRDFSCIASVETGAVNK